MFPFQLDSSDGMTPKAQRARPPTADPFSMFSVLGQGAGGQDMTHWYRMLQMLPRPRKGGTYPSQRQRLGAGFDVARTRMRGLFNMMAVPPWG